MANTYEVFISDAVLQELNYGNYPRKRDIMEFVSRIPLLPLTHDLEPIVDFYIAQYVMPQSLTGDAVHLAYASYYVITLLQHPVPSYLELQSSCQCE